MDNIPEVQRLYRQVKDQTYKWLDNIDNLLKVLESVQYEDGPFSWQVRELADASNSVFRYTPFLMDLYDDLIDLCKEYV